MNAVIEHFHFLRPLWLLAVLPAVWLFFLSWKNRNQASEWQSEIAPHLLPWLVDGSHSTGSKLPWYILLLLWLVAAIALAGPTWEKLPQPLMKDSSALVVLFDLSPSMNVKDVTPSRVVRARLKLIDLLDTRKEGLTALVAYAGEAHVVTPLTDDVDTIKNLVPSLAPQTMPVPGSNAEMAMEMANRLLKDAGIAHGNILFITDGIAPAAFTELKKLQAADGHKVSVWGFGTRAGAPIQLPDGGFARSKSGEIVVAKLEDEELSDAAIAMGGIYVPFTDTTEDIDTVRNFSSNPFNKQQRAVEREFDQWVEFGPWLVLLCLPLVALSFRRGLVLSLLLATSLQHVPEANAQTLEGNGDKQTALWDDLWLTRNQRAQRALDAGDAERAAALFEHPQRKGAANFRADNFEEAAEFFKQTENTAESWFNQGTALTHAGKYDEALAAYNKALELQPEFPEASNNLDITKKLRELEQQQQQNNQDQNQQDQQNQQGQNQQNDQQQQGQQQGEQEQNSEQQNAQNDENRQNSQKQDGAQENGKQTDEEQQDAQQQNAESEVDEERAQQDFDKQLAEAQKQQAQQQDQQQTPEQKAQQAEELAEQERQAEQELREAYLDPDQLAASEDQQKLEQLLRRVPDDPGRLLRNKFRYEAQQRRTEADPGKWNMLENAEEERW